MLPYGRQELDTKIYAIFIRLDQQNTIVHPTVAKSIHVCSNIFPSGDDEYIVKMHLP